MAYCQTSFYLYIIWPLSSWTFRPSNYDSFMLRNGKGTKTDHQVGGWEPPILQSLVGASPRTSSRLRIQEISKHVGIKCQGYEIEVVTLACRICFNNKFLVTLALSCVIFLQTDSDVNFRCFIRVGQMVNHNKPAMQPICGRILQFPNLLPQT